MVQSMKPGSVIVDMAVEQGGNCEGSEIDTIKEFNGVKVIGFTNLPARFRAIHQLYIPGTSTISLGS